jgi:hypothetical protein
MGVCQMSDQHLNNAIRMLLKSMHSISSYYQWDGLDSAEAAWYDPDYVDSEAKLDMLNKERQRRQMIEKNWRGVAV